jgi:integrase
MPAKRKKERVQGEYYQWLLGQRHGVYYADGRGNSPDLGRHSLGTRDREDALRALRRLDQVKAIAAGRAKPTSLQTDCDKMLHLAEGSRLYLDYVKRPLVQGGVGSRTVSRYRAVLDKFERFANKKLIQFWQQVDKKLVMQYGRWLQEKGYAFATQYLEQTTLKQLVKWLVGEGSLPAAQLIVLRLKKPQDTTTYCYTPPEVQAIIQFCTDRDDLKWLGDVVVALVTTGLRIGELADLRWTDLDLDVGILTLKDTTRQTLKSKELVARSTKSHRDRTLPIHDDLRQVLVRLPQHRDDRVFHGPRGGKLKPDTVRNVLKREVLAELAKRFPAPEGASRIDSGRVHSFRHYFCSRAANEGVREQMLMAWLGHRESKMIQRYYHMQQDEARRQMKQIDFVGLRD